MIVYSKLQTHISDAHTNNKKRGPSTKINIMKVHTQEVTKVYKRYFPHCELLSNRGC